MPTASERPGVSIVVPVFNSAGSLEALVARVAAVRDRLGGASELILVDDGSRDGSWATVERIAAREPWVRGLALLRNYGQHNAVLCGVRAAAHEVVVTMDDDLQNPPEEIPKLLGRLAEGFEVVYGAPERQQHDRWRALASRVTKLVLQSVLGAETARNISAFRAFRTSIRDAFADFRQPYVNIDVLLTWGASRFGYCKVRHDPRRVGKSSYTLRKLLVHAGNMVTGFSVLPLQIASLLGFVAMTFGFGVLAFVLGYYFLHGGAVPGFTFIASTVAIFAGVQLFALGIIGEYLARLHFRMMERPCYAIRRRSRIDAQEQP
jgi:glycosyltransferase involved in cell wall biosynthesis